MSSFCRKDVRESYEAFFSYLEECRELYATNEAELEEDCFCWVYAGDYSGNDEMSETRIPCYSGAFDLYEEDNRKLKNELRPSYERLDGLLDGLSDAICTD